MFDEGEATQSDQPVRISTLKPLSTSKMSQHIIPEKTNDNDGETIRPAFSEVPNGPHLTYNLPFDKACAKHVETTFNAERVYILASGSLCRSTKYVEQLRQALGSRVAGLREGMTPHTLWNEVLEVADDCRRLRADLIVTIGGGSLTDAAKIVTLALANNADSLDTLARLTTGEMTQPTTRVNKPSTIPIISIPTSLSGGEYSNLGGGTHPKTHQKHPFIDGACGPSLVILSPELTTTTPDAIWLSTGVRAVDHCVEGLCSLTNTTSASDATCEAGLRLLVPGLLRCKRDAGDLEARLQCQLGVVEAVKAVFQHGVPLGASHGIGHQLGPLGVGHGETSCILLPAVCKYNVSANAGRQALVIDILWSDDDVSAVLRARGLVQGKADLGDALDAVVRELGLPRTLKDVKVEGDATVQKLAQNSLQDHWCVTNPRPLKGQAEVMKILEMVRG